jgi:RNA polymerase sigma-70 factor (ECF subfamily)
VNREGPTSAATANAAISDDASLLRSIAAGDQQAMRDLYDRHADLIYTLCKRIVGTRGDAEQVVTDVFFELWRRAGEFDDARSSVRGYLVMLARSRALDSLRRRGNRRMDSDEDAAHTRAAPSPTPLQSTIDAEQAQRVRSALACLDEDQRRAIESAYYGGLSHSEIAEQLGQPLGTVKTRIRAAMGRLRDYLRRGETAGNDT